MCAALPKARVRPLCTFDSEVVKGRDRGGEAAATQFSAPADSLGAEAVRSRRRARVRGGGRLCGGGGGVAALEPLAAERLGQGTVSFFV